MKTWIRYCMGLALAAGLASRLQAQLPAPAVPAVPAVPASAAESQVDTVAKKPYLGWSSWSLESTNYPGVNPNGSASFLTEKNVLAQADVMAEKFKQYGYSYVNIDAAWAGGFDEFDEFARPVVSTTRFPDGMAYVANYVHEKGLKLGSYFAVGLDLKAYNDGNSPIYGTTNCHTRDLVYPDLRKTNGWPNESTPRDARS